MYNLNYAPTTLGVQSCREIISGGTRTKKFQYSLNHSYIEHCTLLYTTYFAVFVLSVQGTLRQYTGRYC
jgi:hypothetical protein